MRWYRAKAEKERWHEEVDILHEEFARTYWAFLFFSRAWQLAGNKHNPAKPGYVAFALERSSMYAQMAAKAKQAFLFVDGEDLGTLE